MNDSEHLLYINIYIYVDSSRGFLFYLLHYYYYYYYVYVKGTKQILIAVCVVEFNGLHLNCPVCKLQFYTVSFTVLLYFLQ